MRLTRDESREITRQKLIDAAQDIVLRHGYHAASVGAIAEAAGYSKGAFFSNFETKDAILLEVLRTHKRRQIERLLQDSDRGLYPDGSCPFLDRYFNDMKPEREGAWMMLDIELELQAVRNPVFGEQYRAIEREFRGAIAGVIEALFQSAGRQMPASSDSLASIVLAVVRGIVLNQAADPSRPPLRENLKLVLSGIMASAIPAGAT